MRSRFESAVRVAVTGTLLLALAGCGGDSPAPPVVAVTPQPVRGVIAQTAFSGFQTDIWISIELLLSQRGVLDITVDWTSPVTWMYVSFGRTSCDYTQLTSRKCPFILSSETKSPKPRLLYTEALDPGTYYLNPYMFNVVEVTLQSQRFELSGEDAISFLTLDGFSVIVEGKIWSTSWQRRRFEELVSRD